MDKYVLSLKAFEEIMDVAKQYIPDEEKCIEFGCKMLDIANADGSIVSVKDAVDNLLFQMVESALRS